MKKSMITVSMNANPVFQNGKSLGNVFITNAKDNPFSQFIEIYDNSTDKLILKTEIIPVGSKIDNAPLVSALSKGEYNCTAYFNSLDATNTNIVNRTGVNITITIQQ